jgi:hypothetical protein
MAKGSTAEIRRARQAEPLPSVEERTVTQPECRHHWIIESPHGAVSSGVCKLCGTTREFLNTPGDNYWENDEKVSDLSRWGRRSTPTTVSGDDGEMGMAPRRQPAITL